FSSAISSVSLRSSSARSRQCIGSLIKDAGIVQVTSRCHASHSSPKHQTPEYPASGSPQLCHPRGGSLERIPMSRVSDSEGLGCSCLTRVGPMIRKEYEYRRNAVWSLELARRAVSSADKAHLLKLAEDWLDLANLTYRQSGQRVRKIGEHPLV